MKWQGFDEVVSRVIYSYFTIPFMRINYKVMSHMPEKVKEYVVLRLSSSMYNDEKYLRVPHSLKTGGKRFTRLEDTNLKSEAGIFTGESVVLRKNVPLEGIGVDKTTVESMEESFHSWFANGGIFLMERVEDGEDVGHLAKALKTDLKSEAFRTLTHEHLHWRTLKGTSTASLVDAVSWRTELDLAIFAEMIHELAGIPRVLDQLAVDFIKKSIDDVVDAMMRDDAVSLFEDIVTHSFSLSFYYPAMISVLMEPVAWSLVEEDFVRRKGEYLNYYFSYLSPRSREIAEETLDLSVDFLKVGGRRTLIDACRKALDFPLKEALSNGIVGEIDPYNLLVQLEKSHEYLYDRFSRSLKGERIETEERAEKNFRRSLVYGGRMSYNNQFGVNILKGNVSPAIYGFSIVISRYAKLALDRPSFIVYSKTINGEPLTLVYDVIAPTLRSMGRSLDDINVSKLSGKVVYRPLDMVGELGYSIVPSLLFMYYSSFLGEVSEDEVVKQLVQIGSSIRFMSGDNKEYLKFVKSVVNGEVSGSYQKVLEGGKEGMEEFLRFWLSLISRVGVTSRFLSLEQGMQC
ncbi:hypothetical protein [Sulfuracidifex tepidarius]|uniref:Uncharacterized protein n=1 Tax=Sulfuracidifex tepidarius TaxID=1294262 RepID=A0A510E0J0_9CREN|nr:hypothetical protein [Sulfuracidifex tepidarius]BBG25957.1 hypothetical protein IC007_0462 [Sulfuracidifex tepidarius]